jgi:hypothetical protein
MEDYKEENLNRYQVGIDLGKDEGTERIITWYKEPSISEESFMQIMRDYTNNLCTTRPKSVNKIMLHHLKQAAEMGNEEARLTLKTINK